MGGDDFQEKAVLAAVRPTKAQDFTISGPAPVTFGNTTALDFETEAGSLEEMFQRNHDRIFRTAYRVTGNAADAEDVLQTVFLRLARGPQSSNPENEEGYFARAAINASLDLLRSRKRARSVAFDEVDDRQSANFALHENAATQHEDRELR